MERKDPISDEALSRNVSRQLASCGLRSPCHIQVQTRHGEVTLTGTVQFVHQRNAAVQAIRTVEGVRRIVEKIKVKAAPRPQYKELPAWQSTTPPAAEPAQNETDATAVASEVAAPAAEEPTQSENTLPAAEITAAIDDSAADFSVGYDATAVSKPVQGKQVPTGMRHTRLGDSYTFECASQEEAERLRGVLAAYAQWFEKNSWIGKPKKQDGVYRLTFHAKSVIEFLRQAGF